MMEYRFTALISYLLLILLMTFAHAATKHDCNHDVFSCVVIELYPNQNQDGSAFLTSGQKPLGYEADGNDKYFAFPDNSDVHFRCILDPSNPNPKTGHVIFSKGFGLVIAQDTPSALDGNFTWHWQNSGYVFQAKQKHENLVVSCHKNTMM